MTTVFEQLVELEASAPEATLFLEPHGDAYALVSRREFLARVRTISSALQDRGIMPDDCIAVWLPNWSDAVAWQYAALAVGARVIGINTRYNVQEIAHVLAKARPILVVLAHDFQNLDLLTRARGALVESAGALTVVPAFVPVAAPGNRTAIDLAPYDLGGGSWRLPDHDSRRGRGGAGDAPEHGSPPDRLMVAFTTSGSTGQPKLAAHSEGGVRHHAMANAARTDLRRGDVMVAALPYSGVFGFNTVMATIAAGATVLLHPVFNERLLVDAMAQFRVTHYVGADDMLIRIQAAWREHPVDLGAWRRIFMADFIGRTPELAKWANDEFGTIAAGVYGSSELFALAAFWPPETELPRRWGGGGTPVSEQIRVRVAHPETGEALPIGSEGELQFQGPNVVDAYLGDAGEGAAAFTDDGWFQSGDLGRLTEDGGFVYICRMGDVLRLRGFLVEPVEIERRLAEHPAVHTAKVVGVRDPQGETRAIGYVTLEPGASSVSGDELRAWCGRSLARFKVPEHVRVIAEMPTVVGTNGAKIRTVELREWAVALLSD